MAECHKHHICDCLYRELERLRQAERRQSRFEGMDITSLKQALTKSAAGAIRNAIHDHGPITLQDNISSAAKRVAGTIITLLGRERQPRRGPLPQLEAIMAEANPAEVERQRETVDSGIYL